MTDVELRITADLDSATKEVAGFRKEYAEMVRSVEKPLRQVNATRSLEKDLAATGKSVRDTKNLLSELQAELIRTENPSKKLTQSYRDATSELNRLIRTEARQATELDRMRASLTGAGVDTTNLLQEQRRLNDELNKGLSAGRKDAATLSLRQRAAALAQVTREQRLANIEAAKADLGVSRYRALEAQLSRTRSQFQLLRVSGALTNKELAVAQQVLTRRVKETQQAMRELAGEQDRLDSGDSGLGNIGTIGAAYVTVRTIQSITEQADAYNLMNARLKLATESEYEFNIAQAELQRIAKDTKAPIESLITLYTRISRPLKEAGRSQEDILSVTEAVSKSFRISGASAEEAQNGVIQFAQALGAGALRGDEFNSVAEQAPRLMQALADSIGVPVGALKDMAAQGELTASVVTDALVSQLETLRTEAETLPDTVGGALIALSDQLTRAVGQTDMNPLIDAIDELAETLSDPVVIENLVILAGALVTLATTATEGGSQIVDFGKRLAFIAANSRGLTTELDKVDQQIKDLDRSLSGTGFSTTIDGLLYSKEELEAKRAALVAFRQSMIEQQTGMYQELEFLADVAAETAKQVRTDEIKSYSQYIGELKELQGKQVADVKAKSKALLSEEKKAQQELAKVRADRLKIEQRYQEALAGIGGDGEASYGAANALKVSARQALANGDIATAQSQAQAALKMIQDLAQAGENTYGFEGFINELQGIELAANDIEQSNAELKIKGIKEQVAALAEDAKKLKDMPVSVKTDEASIEAVRSQIQQLAADLGNTEIVIPVRVQHPDGPIVKDVAPYSGDYVVPNLSPPGFATGGLLRGPGSGTSDSILMYGSNGEFMQPEASVRYYGRDFMEAVRKRMLPRYAQGGLIGQSYTPSIPALNPALGSQAAGQSGDWGTLLVDLGGGAQPVFMPRGVASELREVARKVGKTRPTRR
ncbi:tape measure protein [Pseudomonas sp. NPDC078700]|uniref:tape measure protein n=1 Tax=Pseudomonas sp. NPDC078700 TaxID=3364424 RepID=UPI0037CAADA6